MKKITMPKEQINIDLLYEVFWENSELTNDQKIALHDAITYIKGTTFEIFRLRELDRDAKDRALEYLMHADDDMLMRNVWFNGTGRLIKGIR